MRFARFLLALWFAAFSVAGSSDALTRQQYLAVFGGAKSPYVLANLSVPAAAAYSLRQLSASATKAINVRRSSDSTQTDIGFVAGQLDTATLLAFVGSGSGYVTTWYDQSGNGANMLQATAANQPVIVSSGALIKQNGNPALYIPSPTYMQTATTAVAGGVANFTTSAVINPGASTSGFGRILSFQASTDTSDYGSTVSAAMLLTGNGSGTLIAYRGGAAIGSGAAYTANALSVATSVVTGASYTVNVNGGTASSGTGVNGNLGAAGLLEFGNGLPGSGGGFIAAYFSELMFFRAALPTPDQSTVRLNQENFYSIAGQ